MTRILIHSRTGPDGTLHLDVPLGTDLADREVSVIIESESPFRQEGYSEFLRTTAGAWKGGFERLPSAQPEERDVF